MTTTEMIPLAEDSMPLHPEISAVEQALYMNDLAALDSEQRIILVNEICRSVGLNPLTKPFDYITLNGKLTLYATKSATDQLRRIYKINITAAEDRDGRTDESTAVLTVKGLSGENLANAYMKAETKAKRRVTLSICGMGMLDETEAEDSYRYSPPPLREPEAVTAYVVEPTPQGDPETGEIIHAEAGPVPPTEPAPSMDDDQAAWDELTNLMRQQDPPITASRMKAVIGAFNMVGFAEWREATGKNAEKAVAEVLAAG
jgi:hypothetical protein